MGDRQLLYSLGHWMVKLDIHTNQVIFGPQGVSSKPNAVQLNAGRQLLCFMQMSFLPFPSHPASIKAAAVSRDGKYVAIAADTRAFSGKDQKASTLHFAMSCTPH